MTITALLAARDTDVNALNLAASKSFQEKE
jgi:hypothetical protein